MQDAPEGPEVVQAWVRAVLADDTAATARWFEADGELVVSRPSGDLSFAGREAIAAALSVVTTGFDERGYTPVRRYVTEQQVIEEGALTGRHVGTFADLPATGERVRVRCRLLADLGVEGRVQRLTVSADIAGLCLQLGMQVAGVGQAAAAVAGALEVGDEQVREYHSEARPEPVVPTALSTCGPEYAPTRRFSLPLVAAVLGAVVLAVGVGGATVLNRSGKTSGAPLPRQPASPAVGATVASPGSSRPPVIATAAPSTRPTVQPGQQLVLRADVLFAFDSAKLTPAAVRTIRQLADRIRAAHVTGKIQVNGYTDTVGSAGYDLTLSSQRALAVAQTLADGCGACRSSSSHRASAKPTRSPRTRPRRDAPSTVASRSCSHADECPRRTHLDRRARLG